ncbi:hypothetical protein FO519_004242 [Halicephalobus sp. NKZ332]|nr:hypothetical protein FO519_004242 [Halicephalobus sp. NKZ332]
MSEGETKEVVNKEPPYGAEYAKSNRSSCKGCKEPISKDSLRMAVRTASRFFDGLQDNWFHFDCFWKRAKAENLSEGNIKNMEQLKWDDQERIRNRIAEFKETAVDAPTPKSHIPKVEIAKTSSGKCFDCKEKIQKGEVRIQLKASNFHPSCLKKLDVLKCTAQEIQGFDNLDEGQQKSLIDVFGNEKKRKVEDNGGQVPAKKHKSEANEADESLKKMLKEQADTFWTVKKDIQDHLTQEEIETILQANGRYKRKKDGKEGTVDQLADCIIFGVPEKCPDCDNGTLFYNTQFHKYTCHGYISEYTRCTYGSRNPTRSVIKIPKSIREQNEFLKTHVFPNLPERYYAPGMDEINSVQVDDPLKKLKKKRKSEVAESKSSKSAIVKNGCSIDGDCEVAEIAHVHTDKKGVPYQATLGYTSLAENRNSYYKLQLLKNDKDDEYYLFRSWGRIGSTQGGHKTEYFDEDLEGAVHEFGKIFKDKTGNEWEERHEFKKHPGLMDLLEMELDGKDSLRDQKVDWRNSKSNLPKKIKKLLAMIFDVESINNTMKALDLDTEKMPLGKLSTAHIKKAYGVLQELDFIINDSRDKSRILDASNRFYTMIPHVVGSVELPLLDNVDIIREKTAVLDDLLEIEVAYKLLLEEEKDHAMGSQLDPIDAHYKKLNCGIEVLDKESKEFGILEEYAKKTHGPTHGDYKLEIVDVFKVSREEEEERFKKDLGNVHLLWHGSRTSNYAGILSQGLKIAPPEAPVSGYMFGKGVYFADMVSKSANYCGIISSSKENRGLLLLCEVALGDVQEEKHAKDVKKPKKGKSSVMGVGQIFPDSKDRKVLEDGVVVPIGKPTKRENSKKLDLIYNEYVVYDVSQIRIKYLVKTKFVF